MRKGFLLDKKPSKRTSDMAGLGPLRDPRSCQTSLQNQSGSSTDHHNPEHDTHSAAPSVTSASTGTSSTRPTVKSTVTGASSSWGTPWTGGSNNKNLPNIVPRGDTSTISSMSVAQQSQTEPQTNQQPLQSVVAAPSMNSSQYTEPSNSQTTMTSPVATCMPPAATSSPMNITHPVGATTFSPMYPYMTTDVPKSALHALYGKAPRCCALAADLYHTWHDSGPPHDLHWSSLFICPITAEIFLTRIYSAQKESVKQKDGLVWYKKKSLAEHGAAACAYDCLYYRDCVAAFPSIVPFCTLVEQELPYHVDKAITTDLPLAIPEEIRVKVQQQRDEIKSRITAMQVDPAPKEPSPKVTEYAWESSADKQMASEIFEDGEIFEDA